MMLHICIQVQIEHTFIYIYRFIDIILTSIRSHMQFQVSNRRQCYLQIAHLNAHTHTYTQILKQTQLIANLFNAKASSVLFSYISDRIHVYIHIFIWIYVPENSDYNNNNIRFRIVVAVNFFFLSLFLFLSLVHMNRHHCHTISLIRSTIHTVISIILPSRTFGIVQARCAQSICPHLVRFFGLAVVSIRAFAIHAERQFVQFPRI